jgi:diguanylate cyclase (GGDEF)-like protein
MNSALRPDEGKKNSILIVDDQNSNIMVLTQFLKPDYIIYSAKSGRKAINAAEKHQPDVILLDILMPEMDGYDVIEKLKSSEQTKNIPVIFISGFDNADDEEKGLSLGAADYISKPFNPAIIKLRVKNQIQLRNQLRTIERISIHDQLTDVLNRRGFDIRIEMEWLRSIREKSQISLLMLDIDKFKAYNDTYGHLQGDVLLKALAEVIRKSLKRPGDFVARWGGEEFAILLPNTDINGALYIAEQVRQNIEAAVIHCHDGSETRATACLGVCTQSPTKGCSYDSFMCKADKALYEAKKTGRNKVCQAPHNIP